MPTELGFNKFMPQYTVHTCTQVFDYGDHGLIGLHYNGGYLYGTYMLINPKVSSSTVIQSCVTWV